jgi:hypothetical protein
MRHKATPRLLLSSLFALVTTYALAQPPATIVLKSGEQKPAQNLGFFDGNELIVRTSFAEEPRFPVGQVAYIDFGGGADVAVRLGGAQHAVVLRNGSVLTGQVTRISHTNQEDQKSPYQISFRTMNGQERQLAGADVARVYFSEPAGVAAERNERDSGRFRRGGAIGTIGSDDSRIVTVSSRQLWTPTGLMVRRGERLALLSTGQIRLSTAGMSASPDGSGQNDPGAPLPQTASGALIGRIGNGRPFVIGTQSEVEMPDFGPLILGVNDSELSDNDGAFRVEIRRIQ